MIITKTPYRISFFGGGTDLSPWLDQNKSGLVISASIDRYCYITLRHLPEIFDYRYRLRYYQNEQTNNIQHIKHKSIKACLSHLNFNNTPIELVHHGELPSQSGLGSSSTFTVGLLKSLLKYKSKNISKKSLANMAILIEQKKLKESVGIQDHIAASFGGLNCIKMKKNNSFEVRPIKNLNASKKLEKNVVLVFTGLQRNSQPLEKKKSAKIKKGQSSVELENILAITKQAVSEINSANFSLKYFGQMLNENWKYKKQMHNLISNRTIDSIYEKVMSLGAYGGKLLGSGNGGFLLFICSNQVKIKIEEIFSNRVIKNIKFDTKGSHILYS